MVEVVLFKKHDFLNISGNHDFFKEHNCSRLSILGRLGEAERRVFWPFLERFWERLFVGSATVLGVSGALLVRWRR